MTQQYEVQMQMRQWGSIISWMPQALIEAADDAEAVRIFEARDDWRRPRYMSENGQEKFGGMFVDAGTARMVRRHNDGPMFEREVVASRGKHVPTNGEKRRAAVAKRRAAGAKRRRGA